MNKNDGFTFIEIIVVLFIISTAWVPVLTVFIHILHFTEKIKIENRLTEKLISFDDYIRQSISKIQVPYWIEWGKNISLSTSRDHLSIPYWKGQRTAALNFDCSEGVLRVSSPDGIRDFHGWSECTAMPLKNKRGSIVGIILTIRKSGGKGIRFQCVFGAAGHTVFKETEE